MDFSGGRKLFLTAESGRAPACPEPSCCSGTTELLEVELRKSYMGMCVPDGSGRYVSIVAELCEDSVRGMTEVMSTVFDGRGDRGVRQAALAVLQRRSGGAECVLCVASGGKCQLCRQVSRGGVRCVVARCFAGVKPYAAAPWFLGVTDALSTGWAGTVAGWNTCVSERERHEPRQGWARFRSAEIRLVGVCFVGIKQERNFNSRISR